MKIIIQGDSQDIDYTRLSTYLRHFNENRIIDIDINGLKYKGKITTVTYEGSIYSSCRIIKIILITETELIDRLNIGFKNGL